MSDPQDNSTTGDAQDHQWTDFPGWRWVFFNIIIWLMPMLIVFVVIFNLLCFIAIFCNPMIFPKLSRRNMLIVTGLDLLVLCIEGTFFYQRYWQNTMKITGIRNFLDRQHDSEVACNLINYLHIFLINGTPFFHIGLTIERVLAVTIPLKVKQIFNTKSHCAMLLILFLLSSIAPGIWSGLHLYNNGRCRTIPDPAKVDFLDAIQYNLDLYMTKVAVFIVLLSGCIIVSISLFQQTKAAKNLSESSGAANKKRGKMISSCAVMLFMNLVFFFTHSPRAIFSAYEGYTINMTLSEAELNLWNRTLYGIMLLHNILDPFGYFIGGGFRAAFQQTVISVIKNPFIKCCGRKV